MNKEDIVVALHEANEATAGRYDTISGFVNGLKNGFTEIGVNCLTYGECIEQGIVPSLAIAFDTLGLTNWQKILNNNIPNVMWNCESVFNKNIEVVKQFVNYSNFIFFNPCSDDTQAIRHYLPKLVHGYIPGGVDLSLWKKLDVEKDFDITFFGSVENPDELIQSLKDTMPPLVFDLMMNFVNAAIANPGLSLWHLYQYFHKQANLELDIDQYSLIAARVSSIITNKQRIKMIQALSGFNLTIFGDGPWENYVSEKTKVVSGGNVVDSVSLMNRSKLTLHSQPFALCGGLHDMVLNASAVATPVLCGEEKTCIAEFKNNVIYCNPVTYEDISDKANYYLAHEEERLSLANSAYEIVKNNHKWSDRARSIMEIVDVK